MASPVFAYLTNPNSMSIIEGEWFRNVAVAGDMVYVFHFKIDYGSSPTYPDTPASDTIIFRLYDTDGTTLITTNKPYPYVLFASRGYGDGVSSFYIPASDEGVWEAAYKANIVGLPLYFTGLSSYVSEIAPSDWNTEADDMETQRETMYDYILGLCDDLKIIYSTIPMTTATDGEFTLSPYGESYFTGAIPGIYSMCPKLFFSQVYVPTRVASENYSMALGLQYKARLEHTDIQRGLDRIGEWFKLPGEFIAGIITMGLCIWACVYTMRKTWGLEPGLYISGGIVTLAAVLVGNWLFALLMIGMLVSAIALFWIIKLKKAA